MNNIITVKEVADIDPKDQPVQRPNHFFQSVELDELQGIVPS